MRSLKKFYVGGYTFNGRLLNPATGRRSTMSSILNPTSGHYFSTCRGGNDHSASLRKRTYVKSLKTVGLTVLWIFFFFF